MADQAEMARRLAATRRELDRLEAAEMARRLAATRRELDRLEAQRAQGGK